MRITRSAVRAGLFGLAIAGSLGFGATQATGTPSTAATAAVSCPVKGYDYFYASCANRCPGRQGYCSAYGVCQCGQIP